MRICPTCKRETPERYCPEGHSPTLPAHLMDRVGDALEGTVIRDKYRILKLIGRGGFGSVYVAHQIDMDRLVALKVVHEDVLDDDRALERFRREVTTSSKLHHPHTIRIHDFGETADGRQFYTMEFLEGVSLAERIRTLGRMPEQQVVAVAMQMCKSLSEAHDLGIIHRDLKPENVMLTQVHGEVDFVKILDFGIAKSSIADAKGGSLTETGETFGTPRYISPEQIMAEHLDGRADLYALGIMMYEMLTGKLPFEAVSSGKLMLQHATQPPPPFPAELEVSRPLGELVFRLMAKEPDKRPANAADVIDELDAIAMTHARARVARQDDLDLFADTAEFAAVADVGPDDSPPSGTAPAPSGSGSASSGTASASAAPFPWGIVAIVVVVSVALGLGIWHLLGRGSSTPSGGDEPQAATFRGVTPTTITLGMTSIFSGPNKEYGRSVKVGIEAYLSGVNAKGGIDGRTIEIVSLDDGYDADKAKANVVELVEQRQVFALVGNVATQSTQAVIPYVQAEQVVLFGSFTGAALLRKSPPDEYVFNYQASHAEEIEAIVAHFVGKKKVAPARIAVLAQDDPYGDDGYQGVVQALAKRGIADPASIIEVSYPKNTIDVQGAVDTILAKQDQVDLVILAATYRPAARFVKLVKDGGGTMRFATISGVQSVPFAEELTAFGPGYAKDIVVTQIVPHYDASSTGVLQYKADMATYFPTEQRSFDSLSGWVVAAILVEAMDRAGDDLTTGSLVESLESMEGFDLGIGSIISFSPSDHQGSHMVWGTILTDDGVFLPYDLE